MGQGFERYLLLMNHAEELKNMVALISLSALRNVGPVLFSVGLAIFAAVGLVIAGAIMGAVI